MIFKLTEEQIEEIIEMYGGDQNLINDIERTLNKVAVIDNEEDYYEVIGTVVSQIETLELKAEQDEKPGASYVLDQIIEEELNRMYNNFEDAKESKKESLTSYFK